MMDVWSRRDFIRLAGSVSLFALASCAGLDRKGKGQRVVVVGAGFGGATAAKYIKLIDPSVQVILIERDMKIITGPFSNAVIADMQPIKNITQDYKQLKINHGIDVVTAEVDLVEVDKRLLRLKTGERIVYDRLIIATGVDFIWNGIEAYDEAASLVMPHAWKTGEQVMLLHRQLEAMTDGGLVAITAPIGEQCYPLGVYERASLIAHYLKKKKPKSKVLVLDAKNSFPMQGLFTAGWDALYPGMIEWVPASKGGLVAAVDPAAGKLIAQSGTIRPAVSNVIPPQQAGMLARQTGLADDSGWCPIDQASFESTRVPGIHVIGDCASVGTMPKSAHSANAQAKVCAQAVVNLLRGEVVGVPAMISASYSLIGPRYGISDAAMYRLVGGRIVAIEGSGGSSPQVAGADFREDEANYARGWYQNITMDSYN